MFLSCLQKSTKKVHQRKKWRRVLGKNVIETVFNLSEKIIKQTSCVAFVTVHLSMRMEENVQTVKVRKDTKQYGRRII